jgi:hypothetical protein
MFLIYSIADLLLFNFNISKKNLYKDKFIITNKKKLVFFYLHQTQCNQDYWVF